MSPSPLPSPLPIKPAPAREPELVSKWTILNDEWVQVYRQIVRTGSGLRETPQQAIARSTQKMSRDPRVCQSIGMAREFAAAAL